MVYNKSTVAFVFSVASALAQPLEFNRDVRPIFSDRCLTCHGQDAANKGIRLRLDREESAKSDLGGGKRAIVPGKPEESLLLQRLQTPNKALRMPPAHTGSTVSASEIATLEAEALVVYPAAKSCCSRWCSSDRLFCPGGPAQTGFFSVGSSGSPDAVTPGIV